MLVGAKVPPVDSNFITIGLAGDGNVVLSVLTEYHSPIPLLRTPGTIDLAISDHLALVETRVEVEGNVLLISMIDIQVNSKISIGHSANIDHSSRHKLVYLMNAQ